MSEQSRRFAKRGVLKRHTGIRSPRKVIAVAFDGIKTEAEYFRGWARKLGTVGIVLAPYYIKSGGNASNAVQACQKLIVSEGPFDEIWCVCDVDDTSSQALKTANALSKKSDIKLCLSSRCFEVWLALHWGEVSLAAIQTEREAIDLVSRHHPAYAAKNKQIPFEVLFERTKDACSNADWLTRQNLTNPFTQVHGLVRKLAKLYNEKNN